MLLAAAGPAHADHSVIEHASVGTTGGNGTQHVFSYYPAADGSRVFFDTSEALTADDTDTRMDIYEHVVGGSTNLVSTGPPGGNGAFDAVLRGQNPDGSHVLFHTAEQLVAADTDTADDTYDRSGGTTTLVSTGPQTTFCFGTDTAFSYAISPDGSRMIFSTSDRLVPEDTDCGTGRLRALRRYHDARLEGSQAQASGSFDHAGPAGFSSDLATVYFTFRGAARAGATPTPRTDIYKRSGGVTTLVSVGPDGGNGAFDASTVSRLGRFDGTTSTSAPASRW